MIVYVLISDDADRKLIAIYNDENVANAVTPLIEKRLGIKLIKERRKMNMQADLVDNLDLQ